MIKITETSNYYFCNFSGIFLNRSSSCAGLPLHYWVSNVAIPDHLFRSCPMAFREEDFCYAEHISYSDIAARIYEVPPLV